MRFDSVAFAAFFVVFLAVYWPLRRRVRAQNVLVLAGSYLFYSWWDWRFLALIVLSTVVDYGVARGIERRRGTRWPRRLLAVSVVTNLGLLGVFKYYDFFAVSLARGLADLGLTAHPLLLDIALPVGISFYTFQTLAYTIDVYRGEQRATDDPLAFACYVAFFPQLVAGPIERSRHLLPQFQRARTIDSEAWRTGFTLLVFGLVKKVAIADNMAPIADAIFGAEAGAVSGPIVLAGSLAFAVQIYADFSGYSDVARGAARLLGFELCVNFDQPYRAATPSEFWRRWHISLSQWLRDYLYVPLGGNRGGGARTYRNLLLTMVLGGLWHGAAWNFVLWGAYHGAILCVYRLFAIDRTLARAGPVYRWLVATPVFFALTLYGWLLFRARSSEQIVEFTRALVNDASQLGMAATVVLVTLYYALPIAVHHGLAWKRCGEKWLPHGAWPWRLVIAGVVVWGITHARASERAFIYFQF
jgi:D-alanyl-lipoteichoic acid acyltransferase DltB (MBOAT superfamily)